MSLMYEGVISTINSEDMKPKKVNIQESILIQVAEALYKQRYPNRKFNTSEGAWAVNDAKLAITVFSRAAFHVEDVEIIPSGF